MPGWFHGSVERHREPPAAKAPELEPPSLLLATGPKERAPWVLPYRGNAPRFPFELSSSVLSWGRGAVLVRLEKSVFALSDGTGLVGPLLLPSGTIWVGLAQNDAVFSASAEGALFRADDIGAAARAGGFRRVNAISTALKTEAGSGPFVWSSAGDYLVAAFNSDVYVSSDGGETFDVSTPAPILRIERVVARYDGVIVAQGRTRAQDAFPSDYQKQWAKLRGTREVYVAEVDPAKALPITLISSNAGRLWRRSSFQPAELRVEGSWISGTDSKSENSLRLLAADARTWIDSALVTEPPLLEWQSALNLSAEVRAYPLSPRRLVHVPAPPARIMRRPATQQGFQLLPDPYSDLPLDVRLACRGAECLRGVAPPPPAPARFEYGFFSDAMCAKAGPGVERGSCGNVPLVRPPSLGILDRARAEVTLAALPRACTPRRLEGAAGIGVLLCELDGKTRVELVDDRGRSFSDAELPLAPSALAPVAAAADGTLLLQEKCAAGRPCTAHVRLPVALGTAGAWRALTEPNAIAFRVAPRGVALAIATVPADPRRLSLSALHPDGRRSAIVTSQVLDEDLRQLGVRDGRIMLSLGGPGPQPEREVPLELGAAPAAR